VRLQVGEQHHDELLQPARELLDVEEQHEGAHGAQRLG